MRFRVSGKKKLKGLELIRGGDGVGSHLEMSKVNIKLKWFFGEANEHGYDLQSLATHEEEQKSLMVEGACL